MDNFIDKAKDLAVEAKGKLDDLAVEHADQIKTGIDKAAEFVERKAGEHKDKVTEVAAKAKGFIDDLAKKD